MKSAKQGILIITICLFFLAPSTIEAFQGLSCSVEVCGSPQRCSSGQTCSLCQGHTIVCTCFVDGRPLGWTNDRFGVQPGGINFINPVDSATSSDSATGAVAQVTDVGRNGATIVNISSTLTLNVTSDQFNGTRIGCYDDTGPMNAQTVTLELRDPLPPARPTVQFNNSGQFFTVSWNNIASPFNGYTVTVSSFNPCNESPDVGCNTAYVCLGWSASNQPNMFEFSVSAVCGSVVGSRSAAATVNLQVPNPPTLTATPLYNSSGGLLEIVSLATVTDGSTVTIADGVDGSPIEYIFSYNGSPISVSTGSTPQCTSSSCQHTFRVTSSQAQQYTVTVAARNVVGVGTESAPVTVGSTNTVFIVTVRVREVTCQFLNGPLTSATCTIQYGTDSTYVNLPYNDSSTGTTVNNVTVPLSTPLQRNTLYYYLVSSMGVRMQGTFRTECAAEDLGDTVDTFTDSSCQSSQSPPSVGSVQIRNGTACYDGLQTGSEAVYSCDCGFSLQGDQTRVCQQNGLWSGTPPMCQTDCSQIPPPPASLVAGGQLARNACTVLEYDCSTVTSTGAMSTTLRYSCSSQQWSATDFVCVDSQPVACLNAGTIVGISITIFLVSFSAGALLAALITYCCCVRSGKSSGQPHPSSSEGPQPAPLYDEVGTGKLEVKENVSYGPVETLEMKRNPSYGPVRH